MSYTVEKTGCVVVATSDREDVPTLYKAHPWYEDYTTDVLRAWIFPNSAVATEALLASTEGGSCIRTVKVTYEISDT